MPVEKFLTIREVAKKLRVSERSVMRYIKAKKLSWEELNGHWSDAGTFDSLFKANDYWATQKK